jgi:DNA invertase Pin-like site-specific DNA recombinase
MNVVSYLRVSGATQIAGDGFDRQDRVIEDFCRIHKLTNHREFREEGVSGTVEGIDRPMFSAALEIVSWSKQNGGEPLEAIVVERMDRLARDLMVSELLLKECRTRGIKVFSADQGNLTDMAADGGDPTRVLIRQIMGALAEWEKSVLVRKLRSAKDRLKAAGKMNVEGVKPYGFFKPEAVLLKLMLDWHNGEPGRDDDHADHPKNYREIARLLNIMDSRTRSGKHWTEQNVRTIILNAKRKQ